MTKLSPFHLAIPVNELKNAREFYSNTLNFKEGRSDSHWVDYDFFGHQFVIHEDKSHAPNPEAHSIVDGHEVPVPHFGVVLEWDMFHEFADSLKEKGVQFIIEPYIRFEGKPGEQATMFFKDPSGNALEFKSFKDMNQIFAK
ncbi:VOC family protein [Psychroflexus montanilacus]|uniref:VOC family protein n=1 Tax=Psychroflexus montanilacus TaxID=2873598 RepID=UPI001CCAB136|nr:VOC family protein [Psychroflexus montanilacus]MBZ9651969.1 VOC family protein [Psychroflexus montanilacus]